MPSWKLTVRNGSDVDRQEFEDLEEAVAAMRERALTIRSQAPPMDASMLGDFRPEGQVRARLQLSGGGMLHRPTAGVDVRGDGTFVPYRGAVRREELDPTAYETPFEAVRETLAAE